MNGWDVALGAGLYLLWLWIGVGLIYVVRPDLLSDTVTALVNITTWPAGAVVQLVILPILKRRREQARQARITERVAKGDYTGDFARNSLGWKG